MKTFAEEGGYSQISTPCYTAKEDSIVDEQDDREQSPPVSIYSVCVCVCTFHQPRHVRVLAWLDSNLTRGAAVSKGKETLAEGEDLWLVPTT